MGTEEITLGLCEVSREPLAAVGVVIRKGSRERRTRDPRINGKFDNGSKSLLAFDDILGKIRINQKTWQCSVFVEGALDAVEENGTNNAPSLPDTGNLAKVELPVEAFASLFNQSHTLCITADLRSVHCVADHTDKFLFFNLDLLWRRTSQNLACRFALILQAAEVSAVESSGDDAEGNRLFSPFLDSPAACALHSSLIEDLVQNVIFSVLGLFLHNDRRDFDEETLKFTLIPFGKGVSKLVVRHSGNILH
mmetsp:Transcript_20099/g.37764  ORF Transcript_20099/g.37764 Transcript_20099/m.37764 type:complete len:251 (-) Transcript_20099:705-1457(-)